jgi:hypothetical protein
VAPEEIARVTRWLDGIHAICSARWQDALSTSAAAWCQRWRAVAATGDMVALEVLRREMSFQHEPLLGVLVNCVRRSVDQRPPDASGAVRALRGLWLVATSTKASPQRLAELAELGRAVRDAAGARLVRTLKRAEVWLDQHEREVVAMIRRPPGAPARLHHGGP